MNLGYCATGSISIAAPKNDKDWYRSLPRRFRLRWQKRKQMESVSGKAESIIFAGTFTTDMNQEILDQSLTEVKNENPSYPRKQIHLVNDRSIYFKGLFGLLFCILPGAIFGLVLVKMSLDQAKVATIEYQSNPSKYKDASIQTVKNGKTMAYIGLVIFVLEIVAFLAYTSA